MRQGHGMHMRLNKYLISSPQIFQSKIRNKKNALFIAHSRTDIPNLISAIRERDEVIKRLRGLCEDIVSYLENPMENHYLLLVGKEYRCKLSAILDKK